MISEPELVGAPPVPAARAEGHGPGRRDGSGTGTDPAAGPGEHGPYPVRRLLALSGALAGALVASAVWAGGLYVYAGTGPDLRGYRISRDLCADAGLSALSDVLGPKRSPQTTADEHPAVDRAYCSVTLLPDRPAESRKDGEPRPFAAVDISYTLHKKTDPEPEFDAPASRLMPAALLERRSRPVPGLGDRAYLVSDPSGDAPLLRVLDGQAVLTMEVSSVADYEAVRKSRTGGAADAKEPAAVESALIADMRALMVALKS